MRVALLMALLAGCGARTDLALDPPIDAPVDARDAPVDARDALVRDAPVRDAPVDTRDAPAPCIGGTVVGDVAGGTMLLEGGAPLPPARYRVRYVGGCMRYAPDQGWTVHAYPPADDELPRWWIVGEGRRLAVPPGTVGIRAGIDAYERPADCVAASMALEPLRFDHVGGPLGVVLADRPYDDNSAAADEGPPSWSFECVP